MATDNWEVVTNIFVKVLMQAFLFSAITAFNSFISWFWVKTHAQVWLWFNNNQTGPKAETIFEIFFSVTKFLLWKKNDLSHNFQENQKSKRNECMNWNIISY